MKLTRILLAGLFLCGLAATSAAQENDAQDAASETTVGKLLEKHAQLPAAKPGNLFKANDDLDQEKTEELGYLLFLPTDESEKTDAGFPLLLFLHGIGERGTQLEKLKIYGPTKICSDPEQAAKWPFILVAPQCPESHFWSASQLRLLVEQICESCPVDRSRIYVTGLSMGGFGTWSILSSWPELVAAAAPVCGGGDPLKAKKMAKTPVWAFHGEKDPLVPCQLSQAMIEALKAAGNEDARLTTYPGVGHDSWNNAYADPELYKWLLSKRLEEVDAQSETEE